MYVDASHNNESFFQIAPLLSPDVEAGEVDFRSSDFLFALELNNIPVSTAKAPTTMPYMNT